MSLCFPQSASPIQECLSPPSWFIVSDPLFTSEPSCHSVSLSVSFWSITSQCLLVCLPLRYYFIVSPCLAPSDILRHNASLSVSLWYNHYVIMSPCRSPCDILRHNVHLSVSLWCITSQCLLVCITSQCLLVCLPLIYHVIISHYCLHLRHWFRNGWRWGSHKENDVRSKNHDVTVLR